MNYSQAFIFLWFRPIKKKNTREQNWNMKKGKLIK